MDTINWNDVRDLQDRPEPGGYIAQITAVEDNEEKKCLFIGWDFVEKPFRGTNAATKERLGFWPMQIARSYKPTALSFFKGFKTAVEDSNRGFVFNNDPQSLVGKFIGVVIGEEEYLNKKGERKVRSYVHQVRSGQAIKAGDFTVPAFKTLPGFAPAYTGANTSYDLSDDDSEIPF